MRYDIKTSETKSQGWRLISGGHLLQRCEYCGSEDQFLMTFKSFSRKSRLLCSGCYAESISSRMYGNPKRA